jgi:RNA polymerase sigma factor (TIGR02999 family)
MKDEVTSILLAVEQDEPQAAERLLPLVHDELSKRAVRRLAQERPAQTLQATALVHEAYLRLTHAEAMRRVLIDSARRKRRTKQGGDRRRVDLEDAGDAIAPPIADLLALDEALEKLAAEDKDSAELVKLRYFAGLSLSDSRPGRPFPAAGPIGFPGGPVPDPPGRAV